MKNTIDVIIFGGQSDMQGQSERLSNTDVVENAFEYRYLEDVLAPLRNPVGEKIKTDKTAGYAHVKGGDGQKWLREHVTGWSASGNTNLVPEFCKAYIRVTGDDRDQQIIDAQDAVCEQNQDFIMLTRLASEMNQMPQYMNPYVPGHFSAEGLELLGKTAGEALGKVRELH